MMGIQMPTNMEIEDFFLTKDDIQIYNSLPFLLYVEKVRKLVGHIFFTGRGKKDLENSISAADFCKVPYSLNHHGILRGIELDYATIGELEFPLQSDSGQEFDTALGRNYHYPSCCINAFISNNHVRDFDTLDRELPYVMHVPCALDCEETRAQNEAYRTLVQRDFPRLAQAYESIILRGLDKLNYGPRRSRTSPSSV